MVKAGSKKDPSLPTRPILVKETFTEVIPRGAASMVNSGTRKVPELPMPAPLISKESCMVVSILPAQGTLDNTKPASLDIIEPGLNGSKKEEKTIKGRGSYNCGKCGEIKKGHQCPYKPQPKRKIAESSLRSSNDPLKKRKKGQRGGKYRCSHCGQKKEAHNCPELAVVLPHVEPKLEVQEGEVVVGRHVVEHNNGASSSFIRSDSIQGHVGNPSPVVPFLARPQTVVWELSRFASPTTVTDEVRKSVYVGHVVDPPSIGNGHRSHEVTFLTMIVCTFQMCVFRLLSNLLPHKTPMEQSSGTIHFGNCRGGGRSPASTRQR
jgi:hypothetical protein